MRQLALAEAHERAASEARAAASRYGVAAVTEKQTARTLSPLAAVGHYLLADRQWPGSQRAQVDLIVVGPSGVFIVDTKAWKDVSFIDGRLYRGQEDVTDDLGNLATLADLTQAHLAEIGLAPGEVHALAVLAGRQGVNLSIGTVQMVGEKDALRVIAAKGNRLTPRQVDAVLQRALALFPEVNAPAPVVAAVPEPVLPAPSKQIAQDALLSDEEVNDALLAGIMAQPIEEWMSFLHPQQAKLVRRSFPGPCRLRGPAGTGKTVVGLHRAAYLARTRPGKILVTSFVKTLPGVLHELLNRLAPEVVDRVEFTGVHAFATRLLRQRGVEFKIDAQLATLAFQNAWGQVGVGSNIDTGRQGERYWEEEIQNVLKGRGITQYAAYADLVRTGRRYSLQPSQRETVWRLYQAYDTELRKRGVVDYADVILLAEAELHRKPSTEYAAVIVDEAQDLSAAMIRMLFSLVGNRPDGFTLIGDGQQSIYPGGYNLAEVGISVAGRGVVLDVNYRNTAEIVAFAQQLVSSDEFADIEGVIARGDVPASIPRRGTEPVITRYEDWQQTSHAMLDRIRKVSCEIGTGLGDVAVLCTTRRAARQVTTALAGASIPTISLEDYSGSPVDAVKVGTIKRAKGLEFKQVLIPDVPHAQTLGIPPADEAEHERWDLSHRELYVAMTRARDGLWVAVS